MVEEKRDSAKTAAGALRQLAALKSLSQDEIEQLTALADLQTFDAGAVIFTEGKSHSLIYFVCHGNIRLNMTTSQCGQQTILSVGPGELLAWSSLVGDGVMTATAVAVSDSQVVALPAVELRRLLDANPALGYRVMQVVATSLSRRLLATRLQLLDLFHR